MTRWRFCESFLLVWKHSELLGKLLPSKRPVICAQLSDYTRPLSRFDHSGDAAEKRWKRGVGGQSSSLIHLFICKLLCSWGRGCLLERVAGYLFIEATIWPNGSTDSVCVYIHSGPYELKSLSDITILHRLQRCPPSPSLCSPPCCPTLPVATVRPRWKYELRERS